MFKGRANAEAGLHRLACPPEPFRLDELVVYPDRGRLEGPGAQLHLEPKVMELLLCLAARSEQVVTRGELLNAVWANVVVCDQVLTRCVSELRKALNQASATGEPVSPACLAQTSMRTYIETVPKRGYRLLARPEFVPEPATPQNLASDNLLERLLDVDCDTLAIMPLQQVVPDTKALMLGTGFSRDVAACLSLAPGLNVVASSSVEHCTKLDQGPDKVAAELGARYVACGSFEPRGETFRLRMELIDTKTRLQLWSRHYDEPMTEFYVVQDQLTLQIARSVCSALSVAKVREIESRGSFDLASYERIHLAEDARRNYNRDAAEFIADNLTAVIETQPENGVAHAYLAMQLSQNLVSGWSDCPSATSKQSAHHLHAAMCLAPNDSRVLMAAGIAALMKGRHSAALEFLERSLELNPNEAHALAEYGMARFYVTNELAPSMALIQQAEVAAPQHPRFSIWAYRRGICLYETQAYLPAIAALDQSIARTPNYYHTYMTKALALIALDKPADSQATIIAGRRHAPNVGASDFIAGVRSFGLTITAVQEEAFVRQWHRL